MAQAARLSLRMQKELKLLLTDPPPGVSIPMLSNDASCDPSSSTILSSFDAQIEGPEGTVYAKGIFNIKIQIPERYPFQPPNVTFATPIYHPNIDNGGRICLDILNLPPKGAWQPSLNISTVLTSIGLLLSEPNPDDGLMCEASREYKYNRQTFDQKARSLTERYAKAGDSGNSSSGRSTPLNLNPSMIEVEGVDLEFKSVAADNTSSKKLSGVRRKLSLESSGPSQKRNDDNKGAVPRAHKLSLSQAESLSKACSSKLLPVPQADNYDEHQAHVAKAVNDSICTSSKKLSGINRKLSLESLSPLHKRNSDDKVHMAGFHQSSVSHPKILSMASSESLSPQVGSYVEQHSEQAREGVAENRPPRRNDDDKENMIPFHSHCPAMTSSKLSLMFHNSNCDKQRFHHVHNGKAENGGINTETKKQCRINKMLLLEISGPSHTLDADKMENLPHYDRSELEFLSTKSSKSMIPQTSNGDGPQLHQEYGGRKKLSGVSRKLCLGSAAPSTRMGFDKKLDLVSIQKPPKSNLMLQDEKADNEQPHRNHIQEAANGNAKQQDEDASLINDAVIVLDSEDSEEEAKGLKRSRLSLSRKRLAGKAKVRV